MTITRLYAYCSCGCSLAELGYRWRQYRRRTWVRTALDGQWNLTKWWYPNGICEWSFFVRQAIRLLFSYRMRAKLWSQTARMGLPNPRRTVCHSICGRPLGLAERYGKDRESGRGIWSPVLPAENTRLHGHRDTRNIQAWIDTRTNYNGVHTSFEQRPVCFLQVGGRRYWGKYLARQKRYDQWFIDKLLTIKGAWNDGRSTSAPEQEKFTPGLNPVHPWLQLGSPLGWTLFSFGLIREQHSQEMH